MINNFSTNDHNVNDTCKQGLYQSLLSLSKEDILNATVYVKHLLSLEGFLIQLITMTKQNKVCTQTCSQYQQ